MLLFTIFIHLTGGLYKWHVLRQRQLFLLSSLAHFLVSRYCEEHNAALGRKSFLQGPLTLPHGYKGIFISNKSKIGRNVVIHQNVTIGSVWSKKENKHLAPQIGDNVLIGANAVIIGGVVIGENAKIGAGAVVNFDVPNDAVVVPQKARLLINGKEQSL